VEAEYQKALQRNPHLGVYIQDFVKRTGNRPEFVTSLSKDIQDDEYINLIFPVGDPVFIHLYGTPEMGEIGYYTIEPPLNDLEKAKYDADKLLSDTKEQIARMQEKDRALLSQAGRDLLLELRQEINAMLARIITKEVRDTLNSEDLFKILSSVIKNLGFLVSVIHI